MDFGDPADSVLGARLLLAFRSPLLNSMESILHFVEPYVMAGGEADPAIPVYTRLGA